jgi:type I restriction enzyme M protein
MSYMDEPHIQKVLNVYKTFAPESSISKVIPNEEILKNDANLSIQLYVKGRHNTTVENKQSLNGLVKEWNTQSTELRQSITNLITELKN